MRNTIEEMVLALKGDYIGKQYKIIESIKKEKDLIVFLDSHFKKLIYHSFENVPYYKKIFSKIEIIKDGKIDLSKFQEVPILTKELLRINKNELCSNDYKSRNYYNNQSGGSTGEPTTFLQDNNYRKWYKATYKYYLENLLDIDMSGSKKILLWGNPRDLFKGSIGLKNKINNFLSNTFILNSFQMSINDMENYIKKINSYKPNIIRGYAGSLYELAIFSEKNCFNITGPDIIISSAETLTKNMREKIEEVFGTKVYDFYGSRETASIAGECKDGLIHVFSFNNYLEVLDSDDMPVGVGEEGRVVITNLHNYSMPLIRYEIGDLAVKGPYKCICNSFLPTLKKISGRVEEQFLRKDGSVVIGYYFVHLLGVLTNKELIKKFRVVQHDYELIEIIAVLNDHIPEVEKNNIEEKIKFQMGKNCKIVWNFVEEINKSKSGKYLYTQSFLNK